MAQAINQTGKGRAALDAFLNLLSLITVVWLAYSVGGVVFQLINKYLGNLEPAFGSISANYYALKISLASLIVVTPVYFGVINVLHRKYKQGELDHTSGVYRWLTYLMLLVSALTIIGSLIALISGFLNGNYTSNFILKMLTVIVIAGFIFGYYFFDLKRQDYLKAHIVSIVVGAIVGLAVLASVVFGFLSVPTPIDARNQLLDEQKISALTNVYSYVLDGFRNADKLQAELDLTQLENLAAPGTYDGIEYRKIDEKNFELCAVFLAKADPAKYQQYASPYYPTMAWQSHEAGRQCFQFDVAKELVKLYPQSVEQAAQKIAPARVND